MTRWRIKLAAGLAAWILITVVGGAAWHWMPWVGAAAQLSRAEDKADQLNADLDAWKRAAGGWEASFRSAEARRASESTRSQSAATSLIQQCSARVAEARASARVVERIVTKDPTYDPNRCPLRERVDPELLRDALRPSAPD